MDRGILPLDNNTADHGMRVIALRRKTYLFFGSDAVGKAVAIANTLIETAERNAVDPFSTRADMIARIPGYKVTNVDDLLSCDGTGVGQAGRLRISMLPDRLPRRDDVCQSPGITP